jgi:hypothetical protein
MVLSPFLSTKTNGKKGKSQGYLVITVFSTVFETVFEGMIVIVFLKYFLFKKIYQSFYYYFLNIIFEISTLKIY